MVNLDELIMTHPMFDLETEGAKYFEDIVEHLAEAGIEYPTFVTFDVPKNVRVIEYSDGTYYAKDFGGKYELFKEIYADIREAGLEADFGQSALESPQVSSTFGGMVFLKAEPGSYGSQCLIGPVDHKQLEYYGYYSFLRTAKEFILNPDNVVNAWHFINTHPAFWYRYQENRPNSWATEDGHHSVWVYPTYNKDGIVVMMEHGGTVAPHYLNHYHDFRLDVWGTSFEDAYIQLAKKTHKFFNLDGSERENVDYKKSQIELDLEKAVENLEKHE